ncbi:MAG: hypothetical protein J6X18_03030, partial [Bacteroidales bacterium]|nr:hypothetical protein [Bacteroidales bacterium]
KERGIIANIDEFTENTFKASEVLNTRYKSSRGYQVNFNEGDYDGGSDTINTEFSNFYYNEPKNKPKSLLSKTNDLFKKHKISSLAARFHTSAEIDREPDVTDTAKTPLYGNSHGRNLLKKNHIDQKTNGYEDPYCRVWTYHHQYDTVNKMIRPFDEGVAGEDFDTVVHPYISKPNSGTTDGFKYLRENSVLGENGFVTIAPKGDPCGNLKVEIKKCMFSIENLAWKDVPRNQGYISKEQRGPNGGRIMWFPPYDLDFNENVSVNWNQSNFIGRGESVYTYTNTSRQGTLSFAILIDHPSIVDNIPKHNLNNVDTDSDGGTVDLEADVLRFFAGCQVPALSRKTDCPDGVPSPSPNPDNGKPDTVEPKKEIPKMEKGKHVKFYVYYPNNYSGNGQKMTKSQWAVGGSSDRRWFDYLACGKDTKIVPDGPGYEWNNGAGVSIYNSSYTAKDANFDGNQTDNGKPGQMEVYEKGSYAAWKIVDPKYKLNNVWYQYRVDFDLHQKLYNRLPGQKLYTRGMQENKSNYYDYKNFKLNWELTNVPEDATHSFAEIIAAIMLAFPNSFRENYITDLDFEPYIVDGVPGTDRVRELMNAFKNHEFVAAVTEGGATKQDPINSEMLAIRRERSVKDLIIQEGEVDESCFVDSKRVFQDNLEEMTTVNTLEAKRQRYAAVELWYGVPEVQKLSEMVHNTAGNDEQVEENLDAILAARRSIAGVQNSENSGNSESTAVSEAVALATEGKNMTSRYETEAEYFKEIQRTDPLVYNNIITKFKYFSPAYHSISPEGFNARLTFLQQCTRQGHTISATDLNFAKTAGNLSFGRMPVCVLRIGDFINTKILINSMSINYGANGATQWDMNPEGIGVQPMYAKVQMGITILGGQSLSGPINRLQNAVSFNYYANTGVYDDRSDRINMKTFAKKFDGDGEFVREETVETSSDKIRVYDESEYGVTKTTYEHLWAPTPNLTVKDDNNNKIASYNEFMGAGGTKGMVRTSDGKYVIPNK